jgi:hypothetical protein
MPKLSHFKASQLTLGSISRGRGEVDACCAYSCLFLCLCLSWWL